MTYSINAMVRRHGYAFVSEYRPEMGSVSIATAIGQPLTPWEGGLVQDLIPRASATPNTYSGIYGLGRFPFHTDLAHWRLPPRYLLLRCMSGYPDTPTLLLDGHAVLTNVTLDILTRAIFKPRRPRDGKTTLVRLCEPAGSGYRLRWDEIFLTPASKVGEVAAQRVRQQLHDCEPTPIALARASDILVIDNWRMLHARSPIPATHTNRRIQRIYLESLH